MMNKTRGSGNPEPAKPQHTELRKPEHWDCRNEKEIRYFEYWTNAKLDELFEPSAADIIREQDHTLSPVVHKELSEQLHRGRLIQAVRSKDQAAVARLADTEELKRLAFRVAFEKHGRGREKGEGRPQDYSQHLKAALEEASREIGLIRKIWASEFNGKRNRSNDPTAIDIAARRWGIDPGALINFRKNRSRSGL